MLFAAYCIALSRPLVLSPDRVTDNFGTEPVPCPMPRTPYARRSASLPNEEHRFGPSALQRAFHIHQVLAQGRPVTAARFARNLGVSDRTIKRDIEAMRHHYGAPIAWDSCNRTYAYERDFEFLPLVRIGADEALALEMAGATFAAWRGTPLGAALYSALKKISHVVAGAVEVPAVDVAALIHQSDDGDGGFGERRWFAIALEAIKRRRILRIHYLKARAHETEARTVHPLFLSYLDHRWVLLAFDPKRADIRHFVLGHFQDAQVTAHHFAPPADFDPSRHLQGSMGRFAGNADIEVRVRFDAVVAPYLRERPWHRSQQLRPRLDGGIEAIFRLNNLLDIERRVLACGSHAEVLAPAELRATIRTEVERMHAIYSSPAVEREPAAVRVAEPAAPFSQRKPPAGTSGVPPPVLASPPHP